MNARENKTAAEGLDMRCIRGIRDRIWQGAVTLILAALLLAGCIEETTTTSSSGVVVNFSGTVSYTGYTQGGYVGELYPQGTAIGSSNWLVRATISGLSPSSFTYSLPINGNQGSVFFFVFNDFDSSGDDSGVNDASDCSNVFTLGTTDVTGVDVTLFNGITRPNCP